jgi:hypothetical protein
MIHLLTSQLMQQESKFLTPHTCIQIPKHERGLVCLADRLICQKHPGLTLDHCLQHLQGTSGKPNGGTAARHGTPQTVQQQQQQKLPAWHVLHTLPGLMMQV